MAVVWVGKSENEWRGESPMHDPLSMVISFSLMKGRGLTTYFLRTDSKKPGKASQSVHFVLDVSSF